MIAVMPAEKNQFNQLRFGCWGERTSGVAMGMWCLIYLFFPKYFHLHILFHLDKVAHICLLLQPALVRPSLQTEFIVILNKRTSSFTINTDVPSRKDINKSFYKSHPIFTGTKHQDVNTATHAMAQLAIASNGLRMLASKIQKIN